MAIRATIIVGFLMVFAACASHLKTGKTYQSMNSFPLAVEYYDAGLRESPKDEELKDASNVRMVKRFLWKIFFDENGMVLAK